MKHFDIVLGFTGKKISKRRKVEYGVKFAVVNMAMPSVSMCCKSSSVCDSSVFPVCYILFELFTLYKSGSEDLALYVCFCRLVRTFWDICSECPDVGERVWCGECVNACLLVM